MFDHGWACFISAPILFPYGAAALFEISCCEFHNISFYVFPRSGFLYSYGFINLSRFRTWLHCVLCFNKMKKLYRITQQEALLEDVALSCLISTS
jgi:hypothetical protein